MPFQVARRQAIHCLLSGNFRAVRRADPGRTNHLLTGQISPEQLIEVFKKCRGESRWYKESFHHSTLRKIIVHEFKTETWYIKLYFEEPKCLFISVHPHYEDSY